ncbi:hypothetical protein CH063_03884 [Colletotrichum higginsianum]|uniref:Uncharacterized protein n=1 Tax=Colletotrichum higginsianum (strain IMI 349063) TaxID=759273 RepID=H1W1V7_COLHI|nr:hypothetical protein CH063_03884 [Colletotrichum higginsianum]
MSLGGTTNLLFWIDRQRRRRGHSPRESCGSVMMLIRGHNTFCSCSRSYDNSRVNHSSGIEITSDRERGDKMHPWLRRVKVRYGRTLEQGRGPFDMEEFLSFLFFSPLDYQIFLLFVECAIGTNDLATVVCLTLSDIRLVVPNMRSSLKFTCCLQLNLMWSANRQRLVSKTVSPPVRSSSDRRIQRTEQCSVVR